MNFTHIIIDFMVTIGIIILIVCMIYFCRQGTKKLLRCWKNGVIVYKGRYVKKEDKPVMFYLTFEILVLALINFYVMTLLFSIVGVRMIWDGIKEMF